MPVTEQSLLGSFEVGFAAEKAGSPSFACTDSCTGTAGCEEEAWLSEESQGSFCTTADASTPVLSF